LEELCGKTVSAPLPKPFLRRIREIGFGDVIRKFLEKT
jgi:hypothetical protein